MKAQIELYNDIIDKVQIFYKGLRLDKLENDKGRKLAIPIPEILGLGVFKQYCGIPTKIRVYKIFKPDCSYKTLVVNINRFAVYAALILALIIKANQRAENQHLIKHTDSTDVPVCANKKAYRHKTMRNFAAWGHNGQDYFFGLKLHLTADLDRKILSIAFSSGNAADKNVFMALNHNLKGIFIADSSYVSEELAYEFYIEGKRILLAKPRKNMKKLATPLQNLLYNTRMQIEIHFGNLKQFYNLVTSLPRSVNGYLANYIYSLLAYLITTNL